MVKKALFDFVATPSQSYLWKAQLFFVFTRVKGAERKLLWFGGEEKDISREIQN